MTSLNLAAFLEQICNFGRYASDKGLGLPDTPGGCGFLM